MKTFIKTNAQQVLRITAIVLVAALTETQSAFAADVAFTVDSTQDPAAQAARQAIASQQIAMQQAQQANQQAMQDAQATNQAAMQAAQQATPNSGSSTSRTHPQTVTSALTGGPIPSKIATAKTVYFMNDGTDPNFPMDETMAVHEVFTALQQWGHYLLVDNPNQADLTFVLHSAAPVSGAWTSDDGITYTFNSPTFVLNIVDAKTNATLWTVTSPVPVQGSRTKRAEWFSLGVQNLVSRLKVVVGEPLSTVEQANLTKAPESHIGRVALIVTGSMLVAGIAGGIILHHEFENSVANQKQQGLDWCTANHMPLSECPANY